MSTSGLDDYLSIEFLKENELSQNQSSVCLPIRNLPFSASPVHNVEIISANKVTTGEDVKVVYDLVLDVEDIQYEFKPGDTIGILPFNDTHEVEEVLKRLNLISVADQQYCLSIATGTTKKKACIPVHIPPRSTIREVFLKCVDIRSVPKKLFLRSLVKYTTQQEEIETLQILCSPSGSKQYNEFINKNKTLLSLLQMFPSCNPPIERLLENLPPLQPRPYSISSGFSKESRKELHVTFAVIDVNQDTKGVCTGWLQNCIEEFSQNQTAKNIEDLMNDLHIVSQKKVYIPIYFRKSNAFRLPISSTVPIIMIGPGTGIAPFVGFLEHRFFQTNVEFGPTWLFYGCRYSNRDFLFKNKIQTFQQNGTLSKLFVCFSRETNKKVYVQNLIVENGKDFVDLIRRQNAIVYVCGDAKNMLKDIRNAIVSCLVDVEGLSNDDAEAYLKEMEQTNRYIKDIWI